MKKSGFIHEIWEFVKMIVMAVVLACVIVQFIRPTTVDGISMYPTFENKDYLLINRISHYTGVKRGQVVVFDSFIEDDSMPTSGFKAMIEKPLSFVLQDDGSTKDLIKRAIAIPGDHLVIKDGVVSVNGKAIDEPYVSDGNYTEGNIDITIPEGKIFCMGDNRMRSLDSRYSQVGLVPKDRVIGTVLIRVLPLSHFGTVE